MSNEPKPETNPAEYSGWHWPAVSKKAHYFHNSQVALCGGYLSFIKPMVEQGNNNSPDNCAKCKRLSKKYTGEKE